MLEFPLYLDINAKNYQLFGLDEKGDEWAIRWCGNGAYSHWILRPVKDLKGHGLYLFIHDKQHHVLMEQIQAAEHRFKIYS